MALEELLDGVEDEELLTVEAGVEADEEEGGVDEPEPEPGCLAVPTAPA